RADEGRADEGAPRGALRAPETRERLPPRRPDSPRDVPHRRGVGAYFGGAAWGLLGLASLLCVGRVEAQLPVCEDPFAGPCADFLPASGARGVTLDAFTRVLYTPGFFDLYTGDPAELFTLSELLSGASVPGRVSVVADALFFVPDPPLRPGLDYRAEARDRGGIGPAETLSFEFRTGSRFDVEPPSLGGITDVRSTPAPGGGYRIDVEFEAATDDGSLGSLEYLLYQSRGLDLDAPRLRDRLRHFSAGSVVMSFVLPEEEAMGPICVVVHAVDGVGKIDDDGAAVCLQPREGSFFAPLCALPRPALLAAPASGHGMGPGLLLGGIMLLWLRRRGRARRRSIRA
ncbi:MAG: hypothetical protein OEY14_18170, partial [Myxococcales bacterium]|nr:hypothetical protein [Myxococcales bacterium]